jgi:hypothetical protein
LIEQSVCISRYGYPVPYAYYPPGYGYYAPPAYAYHPPAYGYYPQPPANGDYPTADDNYPPQGDDYPAANGDYEGYPPESGEYPSTEGDNDIQAKMAASPNCRRLRRSDSPGVQSVSRENPRNPKARCRRIYLFSTQIPSHGSHPRRPKRIKRAPFLGWN